MSKLFKEIRSKEQHQRSQVENVAMIQNSMLCNIYEILLTYNKGERNWKDTISEIKEVLSDLKEF